VANEYCTVQDLYRHGLPRGALANPGQLVASISTSTGVYTLDGHGFGDSTDRTPVTFAFQADGSLQGGVVAGTTYYAEALTDATFKVYAASSGGSAMVPATAGSLVVVVATLDLDLIREGVSRLIDDHLPAHAVPIAAPVPAIVRKIAAELCIARVLRATGQSSETARQTEIDAMAQLTRYRSGIPVRDAAAGSATNTAIRQPITTTTSGWGPASGSIP
jgi:hypothetical protein